MLSLLPSPQNRRKCPILRKIAISQSTLILLTLHRSPLVPMTCKCTMTLPGENSNVQHAFIFENDCFIILVLLCNTRPVVLEIDMLN